MLYKVQCGCTVSFTHCAVHPCWWPVLWPGAKECELKSTQFMLQGAWPHGSLSKYVKKKLSSRQGPRSRNAHVFPGACSDQSYSVMFNAAWKASSLASSWIPMTATNNSCKPCSPLRTLWPTKGYRLSAANGKEIIESSAFFANRQIVKNKRCCVTAHFLLHSACTILTGLPWWMATEGKLKHVKLESLMPDMAVRQYRSTREDAKHWLSNSNSMNRCWNLAAQGWKPLCKNLSAWNKEYRWKQMETGDTTWYNMIQCMHSGRSLATSTKHISVNEAH